MSETSVQPLPVRAYSAALDIGVSYDRSALALLVRLAGTPRLNPDSDGRPIFLAMTKIWPEGAPLNEVVDETVDILIRWRPRQVVLEPVGVGAMPAQEIRRQAARRLPRVFTRKDSTQWIKVNTTRAVKLASYGCVLWGLERGQIVLQREPTLLKQLAGMKLEQSAHAGASLDAENPEVHDDVADALAFSMGPRPAKRGVICNFTKFATERWGGPTLDVPFDFDSEVVETGGGLRLYKRPPVQCVSGGAVAAPLGALSIDGAVHVIPDTPQVKAARELIAARRKEEEADSG